jgi:hypothetical protein
MSIPPIRSVPENRAPEMAQGESELDAGLKPFDQKDREAGMTKRSK